jgi:hypothetical protein
VRVELRSGSPRSTRFRTILALLCTAVGVAALVIVWQQPGFPEVPPQPVDRSVWVVNDNELLVGRVNTGIGELDSAALLRSTSDILQDPLAPTGGTVLVVDQTKHELQVLDTATVTLGARVAIPDDALVSLRGGTVAVADRQDGRLWVGNATDIGSVDARVVDPIATLGALPVVAISTRGTVYATSAGAEAVLRAVPGDEPTSTDLADGPLSLGGTAGGVGADPATDLQITTVGETAVVLDRADTSIRIDGRRVTLPSMPGALLQLPGPDAAEVLIATSDGLAGVSVSDGAVRTITDASGDPTAPVVNGNCRYAGWLPNSRSSGSAVTAVAFCGTDAAVPTELAGSGAVSDLRFRQRGTAVVLTEAANGRSWIADDGYRLVENWEDVKPPESLSDETTTEDDKTADTDLPRLPPDCTTVDVGPPQAADDEYGVRAGRATVLRVMDNDPSVDCTSVVIDKVSALPGKLGSVAIVAGGSAIQVTVSEDATGVLPPIEYEVGNGAGGVATASVSVTVKPETVNKEPMRIRRSAATVEVNGTISYNVLDDYYSPVGDDLFLVSASTDSADEVSFRADGTITYRNTGLGEGTDAGVDFVVSDGVKQTAGTLTVAIAPADSTTPVVYPLFTRAVVGVEAVASPLRSVVSAAVAPVTISTVRPEPGSEGATARLDPLTGSIAVTARQPGSYYLTYEAATGGRAVTGVLRADFVDKNEANQTVVPMTDVAYLPPGGQTVLDPLANDTDPDGEGLAVREVDVDPNAPITAAVTDLHLVQVSASRTPRGTVSFGYSVFDGATTKVGQIRIVPVPAPKRIPPPLAAPITATVRAGDAVTIPISGYATSQDGTPVTAELDPAQVADLPGRAFSTGETIRYLAPANATPGQVTFGYTAVAGSSTPLQPVQTVSTVTITVTDPDPARNTAPNVPTPVTARVFAGGAISIAVPLAGVDPDGDWVVLQSLVPPEAPLGDTALAGANTLSYKAFDVPGVDRIEYVATDPAGLTVTGEITVLVVAPATTARPPDAPDIAVAVRPGSSIRIDPLSLVTDPGGRPVELATPAFTASAELQVEQDGQSLIVTAPPEPTVASLSYTVINSQQQRATGSVKVTVSPDAPTPVPVAADVFVRPADLAVDKQTVDVDVSNYITNRSGRRDQLTVSVDELSAAQAVKVGAQVIRVSTTPVRQIVAYQVTDSYGSTASGFIVVPPQQQLVGPQLIAGAGAIRLDAGQSVDVQIADYVAVGGGGTPSIATSPEPRITQGTVVRTTPTTLTLTAPSSAGGQAALYVPIDDGTGPVVVLTIGVEIKPRLVPPPRLDSTQLEVEAGTSAVVDLAPLTTTADQQQADSISYAVGAGPGGITATQDGSSVTVSVQPDVPRGTEVVLPVQVVDGEGRDGKATVTVTVTGSRKPLPTVVDQQIAQGRAEVQVSADLLTGSIDPVGLGLRITSVSVVEGNAGVAAGPTLTGSTVQLTPAAGFVGDIVVAAEVLDGTKDPERVVTAKLQVSIQDRPSTPGTPAVVDGTLTADSVQLAWSPADANGAAIEGYSVVGSGIRQDCAGSGSACVIGGLTPGLPYVFVVTARNSVGESDPSAPSAVIVPDAVPSTPAAPTVQYVAGGQVTVSWTVPQGAFTPVTGMSVQVLRGDTSEIRDNVSSPLSLSGLDLGSSYRFQVRASNQQGSTDWSAPSEPIVPSDKPGEPSNLNAQFVYSTGQRGIAVSWGPPANLGGEAVQSYQVLLNNSEYATVGGDVQSTFIDYPGVAPASISVIARNSRGAGPAATTTVAPFERPSQVTGLVLAAGDRSLQASWDSASSPGSSIANYDYRINGGQWGDLGVGAGTSAPIAPLVNGTTYQIEVRACNSTSGFGDDVRCGEPSAAVSGTPFGPLTPPDVAAELVGENDQQVKVDWTFPDGNGREIVSQTVTLSGAVSDELDPKSKTWTSKALGLGKKVTVTVSYCVKDGTCSDTVTRDATTPSSLSLATVAVGALAGTCGTNRQLDGEWAADKAACGNGTWVPAPRPVEVKCQATGTAYPSAPAATTTDNRWYRSVDNAWYRYPSFVTTDIVIPEC